MNKRSVSESVGVDKTQESESPLVTVSLCKSSPSVKKKKYLLCSPPNKEQIGGGYLAPGLVLTLTNFIQENKIIFFIFFCGIWHKKKANLPVMH